MKNRALGEKSGRSSKRAHQTNAQPHEPGDRVLKVSHPLETSEIVFEGQKNGLGRG